MSETNSSTEKPLFTPVPPPLEESRPETSALAGAKRRRPRVIRPDLTPIARLCVGILAFITSQDGRVTLSQVKRGLNSYRHPQVYEAAIRELLDLGAVKLEKEPGSRRQWISVLQIPKRFRACQLKSKRRRHPHNGQGRSLWFEALLAQRRLTKALAILTNDIREARKESCRRAVRRLIALGVAK